MFDKKQLDSFIKKIKQQKRRYYHYLRPIYPQREWFVGLLLSFLMLLWGGFYIYKINSFYANFNFSGEISDDFQIDKIFKKRSLYNALTIFDQKEKRLREIVAMADDGNKAESVLSSDKAETEIGSGASKHQIDEFNSSDNKHSRRGDAAAVVTEESKEDKESLPVGGNNQDFIIFE